LNLKEIEQFTILRNKEGHAVAQLVEALRYKPEGPDGAIGIFQ
jgi:hypothetical protein